MVPSINEEHFFGGTSTALSLLEKIQEKVMRDVKIRIIITDARPKRDALKKFNAYNHGYIHLDSDAERELVFLGSATHPAIHVTSEDRFVSTAWWTAYKAINVIEQQVSLFGQKARRLLYFIQDFEPGFYNWSSHYALAESTYRSIIPTIAVFNSSFLRDYFKDRRYSFFKEYVFEPRLNPELRNWISNGGKRRKKTILFYGRPSVDRNCFPLVIETLRLWIQRQPDHRNWEIISIGEDHPTIDLGDHRTIKSMGKLRLADYARLLNESAIGISFMVSPHPSYPPLEMAHFGLLTLTNSFASKDLSRWHENIVSLTQLTPDTAADGLLKLTRQFVRDPGCGLNGKSLIPSYTSGVSQFPFIDELLLHFLS